MQTRSRLVLTVSLVFALSCRAEDPSKKLGTCPPTMALVAANGNGGASSKSPAPFCVDPYEASLLEATADGDKPFSPYEPVKERRVHAVSRAGAVPQAYVSQIEALAACKAAGKRLCSEDEWVTACRGPGHTRFPYGADRKSGYCNDEGKSPLVRLYGGAGARAFDDVSMNDPRLNQQPDSLAPAGSHRRCTNDYGVFDMVGNLHEWVDDPNGTFRGGYYLDTRLNGDGCSYRTTVHSAAYKDYSIGFRCCADVKR